MHGDVSAMHLFAGILSANFFFPPIQAIGVYVPYVVIENVGAVNGLIEIPLEVLVRNFFDCFQEIFGGGVFESVAQKIFVHGGKHSVFADDFLECEEQSGGFAVGDPAIGSVTDVLPGKTSQWIGIRK